MGDKLPCRDCSTWYVEYDKPYKLLKANGWLLEGFFCPECRKRVQEVAFPEGLNVCIIVALEWKRPTRESIQSYSLDKISADVAKLVIDYYAPPLGFHLMDKVTVAEMRRLVALSSGATRLAAIVEIEPLRFKETLARRIRLNKIREGDKDDAVSLLKDTEANDGYNNWFGDQKSVYDVDIDSDTVREFGHKVWTLLHPDYQAHYCGAFLPPDRFFDEFRQCIQTFIDEHVINKSPYWFELLPGTV